MERAKLEALEELALAASAGPWEVEFGDLGSYIFFSKQPTRRMAEITYRNNPNDENDASFIAAASPDVVLALIKRVRELEEAHAVR